ncbi:MAG: CDGSH iron-sulfur domain-containing protein, partial [Pseudomonadota bacterium]
MKDAIVAGKKPRLIKMEKKGDTVMWCACGRSTRQPFCDGSHKGTSFTPVRLTASKDGEEALLCLCKRTRTPPYCDGSHNGLDAKYGTPSEEQSEEQAIDWAGAELVSRSDGQYGRARLDGDCFVLTPHLDKEPSADDWRALATIGNSDGADKLSQ